MPFLRPPTLVRTMHPLLRYMLIATPLAVLVFLWSANFFTSWTGHAVSFRPTQIEDAPVLKVMILDSDRNGFEVDWPSEVVDPLKLKTDRTGVPPNSAPEGAPETMKTPFSLTFSITPAEGEVQWVPTTSPRSLSVAALMWMAGLFLHNMWLSGSPFSWERRELELPETQKPTGATQPDAKAAARARSKQGPPPNKRRRGQGRRR